MLRVGEVAFVPQRGGHEDHHQGSSWQPHSGQLRVLGDEPEAGVPGGLEAEHLLEQLREERPVRQHPRSVLGALREDDRGVREQVHRGLHSRWQQGEEVEAGRFRKDLLYRLRVVELEVPPLRERREDILPLARGLLAGAAMRLGRPVPTLTPRAADQLVRYDWPGNVRELENAMERAIALAQGRHVELEDLPEDVRGALPGSVVTGGVRTLEEAPPRS